MMVYWLMMCSLSIPGLWLRSHRHEYEAGITWCAWHRYYNDGVLADAVCSAAGEEQWEADSAGQAAAEAAWEWTSRAHLLSDGSHAGHIGRISAAQTLSIPGLWLCSPGHEYEFGTVRVSIVYFNGMACRSLTRTSGVLMVTCTRT